MTTWHSVFWSPSKHRWLVRLGAEGRTQRQITVPQDVAPGPRARKAAEEWARAQLEKPVENKSAPSTAANLAQLAPIAIELWTKDERIAPKTRADRISFVRLHILLAFGDLTIEAIDVPKVRAWVRAMRIRGDARASIGNRLSTLSTLLSDLHAEGHGPDNRVATAKAVRDELPAMKKRAPVALGADSFSVLIWADSVPFWFRLLCALAGLAGLEAGTALGLEVRDVVFVDGCPMALRVRQSVAILGPEGHASIGPTKNEHRGTNERPRVIPVHPALAALLVQWLDFEREKWCCSAARPNDLLVPSSSGKPWRPKVADRLRRDLEGLGLEVPPGLVFHRLRGCFATWLAAAGVPKDQRQRLMGHAGDVEATHYEVAGQLFESDFEAVARIAVEVRDGMSAGGDESRRESIRNERGLVVATRRTTERIGGARASHEFAVDGRRVRLDGPRRVDVVAVPFAVPCDDSAAQQVLENACFGGAPGRNRTCDQRFRNARELCWYEHVCANEAAQTSPKRHKSSGVAPSNGSSLDAAVPDAVREACDGLRWMLVAWDGAEAMLAGLETS